MPPAGDVPQSRPVSTYNEPTVMWRMRRRDGGRAHAVIGPHGRGAWVMWFVNDRPVGVRDFKDVTAALQWVDRLRVLNWTVGWRPTHERDDAPSARRGS